MKKEAHGRHCPRAQAQPQRAEAERWKLLVPCHAHPPAPQHQHHQSSQHCLFKLQLCGSCEAPLLARQHSRYSAAPGASPGSIGQHTPYRAAHNGRALPGILAEHRGLNHSWQDKVMSPKWNFSPCSGKMQHVQGQKSPSLSSCTGQHLWRLRMNLPTGGGPKYR